MFNKLQFNNLVITHKKSIQQARVQTINRLVQKLRKLKKLLEKRPEDEEKIMGALHKNAENIEHLKKIKRFDVMRKVLLLETKPNSIITNGRSTPEEMAIALLAMNKIMQQLMGQFREELKLNEIDSAWRHEIVATSKRHAKIERAVKKREKRKQLKEEKAIERKRCEWLQQQNNGTINTQVQHLIGNQSYEYIKKERFVEFVENETKKQSRSNRVLESSSEIKMKQLEKSKDSVDTAESITHVVDPFFITETGDNYLSTAVNQFGNYADVENNVAEVPLRIDCKLHHFDGQQRSGRKFHNEINAQKANVESKTHKIHQRSINVRHPSWVAKQKQKSYISNFTGKKFGGSGLSSVKSADVIVSNCADMHPSWVAKQRFKPKIANFEGKKIIFNDDD